MFEDVFLYVPLPQTCSVISNNTIHCPSHSSSESQQTSVQFLLNGVLYTDEGPLSPDSDEEEEEEEEEDSNKGHFSLEYVEDPQFFTANKEKLIKHHPGEPLTLIINVSDADSPGTSCFQRLYIIILCVVDIKDVKIRHIILLAFKIFKPPPATSQHTK